MFEYSEAENNSPAPLITQTRVYYHKKDEFLSLSNSLRPFLETNMALILNSFLTSSLIRIILPPSSYLIFSRFQVRQMTLVTFPIVFAYC